MQRMTGLLVGAVFGAVFVLVNAGGPLGGAVAGVLRVAACLGAAGVVAMWFMTVRGERRSGQPQGPGMYGRGYLLIVLGEVVLLFGGLRVLAALGAPEQANVAWAAFVVGVHFVALAPVWKDWTIAVPGGLLALLGVAGFALAGTSALAWVPIVSGVASGVVLLAASLTTGWRTMAGLSAARA